MFYDNLKMTSVSIFITDFDLLICELDNFTFRALYYIDLLNHFISVLLQNTFTTVLQLLMKKI